jgi:hypothetical protein
MEVLRYRVYRNFKHRAEGIAQYMAIVNDDEELMERHKQEGVTDIEEHKASKLIDEELTNMGLKK